ncbi:MAG: TonB-dependent receptor [Magnetococcales bacterium]|nr:TonB-dependent receptor [Magnetococcales bacterium]NGZ26797.1 TonB-dependent receptor [Magnetococcales bacterium]
MGGVSQVLAEQEGSTSPATPLQEITVTATREGELKAETPASVSVVKEETLKKMRPTHPKEVLNQVAGVWVSNLSGEGHSTSIRHPLTTSPVYLYLEDGIPTRSTGFFNHNALYEVNVPQSGGIEVVKGPGSALYGSDAIGGTVNVLTRTPPAKPELELTGEAGLFGWGRVLASGGTTVGNDGFRGSVNLTRTDGWHDHSNYERQAANARWDHYFGGDAMLKTVVSYAKIDQSHVGEMDGTDFAKNPQKNNTPLSYRQVEAFRLSLNFEKEGRDSLISVTPYYRHNVMEILPNWSLSYDPSLYTVKNDSFGFLSKYRKDFEPLRGRLIIGLDGDYSPGSFVEDSIAVTKQGTVYTGYTQTKRIYDYEVTYSSLSPYLHGEISPWEGLRLTGGVRYDSMRYEYDNKMANGAIVGAAGPFPAGGFYGHVPDGSVSYSHLSPKLGATYAFHPDLHGFIAFNHAFRTPSQNQVFRGSRETLAGRAQVAAQSLLDLKPVKVNNLETGLRGKIDKLDFELALYEMRKKDDLVSYRDPATNQRTVVNAGKTSHQGAEIVLGLQLAPEWRVDSSLSYTQHRYEQWVVSGTVDYSGKEMETAPSVVANSRLTWSPSFMNQGRLQLEWVRLGEYWRDAANTSQYPGHDLINLRGNYPINPTLEVYGSVNNVLDKRYAETSSLSGTQPTYTVGLPLVALVGVQARW